MKLLIALAPLLLAALACSNPGNTSTTSNNAATAPSGPAVAVKAVDLVKAYKDNELAADEKYKGKTLEVTGKITGIAEVAGYIQVDLEGKDFVTVKCVFAEDQKSAVAKLKNGQTATLIGTGDGMTVNLYVGLDNCRVKS